MANHKIPHDAVVLVCDGEKAMFLRNEGNETRLNLVVDSIVLGLEALPMRAESDRANRRVDALGPKKSAFNEVEWYRLDKDRFAKDIASMLYRSAHAGSFEKLVIVAPPRTLGEIRAELHQEVRQRLVAEIDKDLTGHAIDRIEQILAEG